MIAVKWLKDYPVYEIEKIPAGNFAYHYSKSVFGKLNHKITSEKDIYRKPIDDTTLIQLNLSSEYDWTAFKGVITGDLFLVDKRSLKQSATGLLKNGSKYPEYERTELNFTQNDSILKNWKLSRFDK